MAVTAKKTSWNADAAATDVAAAKVLAAGAAAAEAAAAAAAVAMIEERIDQRLLKLAESQGIADVNTNVSAFMENALHARLEQVIKQTTLRARQRADINRSAFSSYHVESDPR